jgi:hypothetical protein
MLPDIIQTEKGGLTGFLLHKKACVCRRAKKGEKQETRKYPNDILKVRGPAIDYSIV